MLKLLSILPSFLALGYTTLLIAYRQGWRAIAPSSIPIVFVPSLRITVLIPARNEAARIAECLQAILKNHYPIHLLNIIVLDDFSTDDTLKTVAGLQTDYPLISAIKLADYLPAEACETANKKAAIALGVAHASGEIIACTDADCFVSKDWLTHISAAFEDKKVQMVCGPVQFHRETTILQRFQSLDFMGLMGITGAGLYFGWHIMANGANLAYRKSAFEAVHGYVGNESVASGDDLFLAQKVSKKWPKSILFLKNKAASVYTEAMPNPAAFWQQRLRWGTKNAALPDWPLRLSLLWVFLFCWALLGLFFGVLTGQIPLQTWAICLFLKAIADFLLLREMSDWFGRRDLMRWFLPAFILHTLYIPMVGTASIFTKKYRWKGRTVQ